MKNLSLDTRKKLHEMLDCAVILTGIGGGAWLGYALYNKDSAPSDDRLAQQETAALQSAIMRLETLKKYAGAGRIKATELEALPEGLHHPGLDATQARQDAANLSAAFDAAAHKTIIDVIHARNIGATRMYLFENNVASITDAPHSSAFGVKDWNDVSWEKVRECQAQVMSVPGFAPDTGSARRILACAAERSPADTRKMLAGILGFGFLGIAGVILRECLDFSISVEEQWLQRAQYAVETPAPAPAAHKVVAPPVEVLRPEDHLRAGTSSVMTVKKPLRLKIAKPV